MVAKSIAKMYTNIHKPTDYYACISFSFLHLPSEKRKTILISSHVSKTNDRANLVSFRRIREKNIQREKRNATAAPLVFSFSVRDAI